MEGHYGEDADSHLPSPASQNLCKLVEGVARRRSFEAGAELPLNESVCFPIDGVTALALHRGRTRFQVGFCSRGDAIGIQGILVPSFPDLTAMVLKSGSFICVPPQTLNGLLRKNGELRERVTRHALFSAGRYLEEAARVIAMSVERRVAHWISRCGQALKSDVIAITHNDLANVLGVRRSGVTVALQVLEGEKLIRSRRSRIEVVDCAGLVAFSGA